MLEIYKPMTERELSQRKIEEYSKFSKIIQKGRNNPVWFVEEFYGIKLMDYQKWVLMNSWWRPFVLWLCCRAWGKTILASVLLQAKMVLIPNYRVYIATNSAQQSIEVFKKIEDLALQNIPSFQSLTDIFAREVEKKQNSPTGFIHSPTGHHFKLFNNSELQTLSSNDTAIRGKRGSVLFDETAWQTEERMRVLENLIDVDSNFKTSTETVRYYEPEEMPLQLLYASSAGDEEFPFYNRYVDYSKHMLMGNPNYFVCDLDCYAILNHSTIDGESIKSHLTEETIKKHIENDPDGAERELFNKFRKGAGKNSILQLDTLLQNSSYRIPLLSNINSDKKFIFCYDPARNFDGSVLSIWQLIKDEKKGYVLQLEQTVSMFDSETKNKTPLPMNEQLKIIKKLMIEYNGDAPDWENIEFYIDAGAGGGGVSAVADQLLEDWVDEYGNKHLGIIDPDHKQYETARRKYPNAVKIVHLIEPSRYKKIIYDALEKMVKNGYINFTKYDNRSYISIPNKNDDIDIYELSEKEESALIENNLLVTEISYMCRFETSNGNIQFELSREQRNKMHDDRAYTAAMAAYALSTKRRDKLIKYKKKTDINDMYITLRQPKMIRR